MQTQGDNTDDYQAKLKQFTICNHLTTPFSESDQPPNGNPCHYITIFPISRQSPATQPALKLSLCSQNQHSDMAFVKPRHHPVFRPCTAICSCAVFAYSAALIYPASPVAGMITRVTVLSGCSGSGTSIVSSGTSTSSHSGRP